MQIVNASCPKCKTKNTLYVQSKIINDEFKWQAKCSWCKYESEFYDGVMETVKIMQGENKI